MTDHKTDTERVLEWIDTHPQWPPHEFMEPCGSLEGTDHCWACGSSKASHAAALQTLRAALEGVPHE